MSNVNELGQPIGDPLPRGWAAPPPPSRVTLTGRYVQIVPLDADAHAKDLFESNQQDTSGAGWTYMLNGPYDNFEEFKQWLQTSAVSSDPMFFAYLDGNSGKAIGYGSFMRIEPAMGCIEVGNIRMSPLLQRTPMSTEAMYLKMKYAFDIGYRRYEWKCDSLNEPSRKAADRLGFTFEGVFRKAVHYKGRNRDTAWFSITDDEWPYIRSAHEAWLDPSNFDGGGKQSRSLRDFMRDGKPGNRQ